MLSDIQGSYLGYKWVKEWALINEMRFKEKELAKKVDKLAIQCKEVLSN